MAFCKVCKVSVPDDQLAEHNNKMHMDSNMHIDKHSADDGHGHKVMKKDK